ncbi:glycosyl hydrolase family 18 protein [Hathewaya massiliensis]|uniref:glycosyl hydrolase family 18 protein n=1 Tax=Hathewaya massiliensis TaxID=1964382 RepID=UPI001FAB15EB|nr:glycosyl hydrolase family 18 protein [Hathewaya massiliensis]
MKKYKKTLPMLFLMFIVIITSVAAAKPRSTSKLPRTPTKLRTVSITSKVVNLTWNSVTASGYRIYRASNNNSKYTLLANTTSRTYKDTKVSAGKTYWYYIVAYNKYGRSSGSNRLKVVVPKIKTSTSTKTVSSKTKVATSTKKPSTNKQTTTNTKSVSSNKQATTSVQSVSNNKQTTTSTQNTSSNKQASTSIQTVSSNNQVVTGKKKVLGFATYYYSGDSSSYNSMVNNRSNIDQIATHNYITDGKGNITGLMPTNQLTYANKNGIETLAMVANNFDGNIAKTLLESPSNVKNLINNILVQMKTNGYKGVNIDLEGIYSYNRNQYTEFIKQLYNTLKPQGFTVTLSVPAKINDNPANTWCAAYDYAKLGNYADKIILMTYDEHYPGGEPGAVASINWVENVIKYAVSVIPKEKILLGTAAYGYDWSSNGTKAYGIQGVYNLATKYGATILWDKLSQTPYFNYKDASGISHTVWFENENSLKYKLDLVNKYDLNGIGIWRLGLENAPYWTSIKEKFSR